MGVKKNGFALFVLSLLLLLSVCHFSKAYAEVRSYQEVKAVEKKTKKFVKAKVKKGYKSIRILRKKKKHAFFYKITKRASLGSCKRMRKRWTFKGPSCTARAKSVTCRGRVVYCPKPRKAKPGYRFAFKYTRYWRKAAKAKAQTVNDQCQRVSKYCQRLIKHSNGNAWDVQCHGVEGVAVAVFETSGGTYDVVPMMPGQMTAYNVPVGIASVGGRIKEYCKLAQTHMGEETSAVAHNTNSTGLGSSAPPTCSYYIVAETREAPNISSSDLANATADNVSGIIKLGYLFGAKKGKHTWTISCSHATSPLVLSGLPNVQLTGLKKDNHSGVHKITIYVWNKFNQEDAHWRYVGIHLVASAAKDFNGLRARHPSDSSYHACGNHSLFKYQNETKTPTISIDLTPCLKPAGDTSD